MIYPAAMAVCETKQMLLRCQAEEGRSGPISGVFRLASKYHTLLEQQVIVEPPVAYTYTSDTKEIILQKVILLKVISQEVVHRRLSLGRLSHRKLSHRRLFHRRLSHWRLSCNSLFPLDYCRDTVAGHPTFSSSFRNSMQSHNI